MIIGK
jgi:hypothetical protein